MADRKERFTIISKFQQKCRLAGMPTPVINKNTEQWAADALLESFSFQEILDAMDYYFKVNERPTWKSFANNADRLLQSMAAKKADDEFRAQMRQKAKEWLNESRG